MKTRIVTPALLALVLVPVLAFRFGGWAVVTVDDLPEYVVVGQPLPLSFIVRQHGMTPLDGLKPRITMTSGGVESVVMAAPSGDRGQYRAAVTAPAAGDWSVRIQSGFRESENTLLPLRAVAAQSPAPRPLVDWERGHQLFVAKGCVTCHVRGSDGASGYKLGPDLTGKRYVADYVAAFLADPDRSPLSRATAGATIRMPTLGLKEREIASLVAFLNADGQVLGTATRR